MYNFFSVILISSEKCLEKDNIKIIMDRSIKSMEIVQDAPIDEVMPKDIFTQNLNSVSRGHDKEKVKNWLEKNLIPVIECKDNLIIDNLEIHPPYGPEQCFSSNSIVLSRIQNLLKQMTAEKV